MDEPATPEYDPSLGNKFIFVTGGVMSGLGKGITAASTGRLLKNAGYDVTAVKVDPYLNVDAGTMSPFQHGEVYVMNDGGEVDLDLGNYERFLGIEMDSDHNITTGKVYQEVIKNERSGNYLGETVQIIPHITNDIKRRIREAAKGHDICIVEIGGTVGDIEGMAFLEALRQFIQEEDAEDLLSVHVTLVPYSQNGEQKTKPTQHSVKSLRSTGLQPDILVGRCDDPLNQHTKQKIAQFCDIPIEAVFSNPDVSDIYHVPLLLEEEQLDEYVMKRLQLEDKALNPSNRDTSWRSLVSRDPNETVTIGLVGKYDLDDAYMSVYEALKHAGLELQTAVESQWIDSESFSAEETSRLDNVDGVIVPGGFGERGIEGKLVAAEYARKNDIPYLGLCLGFQIAVIEYARHVCGLDSAHSTEFVEDTPHPVISLLPEQYDVEDLGGTMRLGAHETAITTNSLASNLYSDTSCVERHRHRYEVNPKYIDQLEDDSLCFSGTSNNRMEILELDNHPYFVGTQFHPEFRSRPDRPSPPFVGLVNAASQPKK